MDDLLLTLVVLLGAAVLAVPLTRRLGLGSILGYLAAGLLIGPSGLGLIDDVESIAHASELGVVMLLFLIGLELRPARLWVMRRAVFGLGSAQVALTGALIASAASAFGLDAGTAIVFGAGWALSSTALVLPLLAERELMSTQTGRDGFAVLLFQDLAIIPMLAALPLLGNGGPMAGDPWVPVLKGVAALTLVLVGGRYLIGPAFRAVAATRTPEIFTATALLVVVGTATLISAAGLSMSLGAFMAGVLLSDSEFRHQLRADIEPFEGLLLGLFFVSVGMGTDLGVLAEHPSTVFGLALALVAAKGAVLFGLARLAGRTGRTAIRFAIALAQGGEFGFILFGAAVAEGAMRSGDAQIAVIVITLSMAATPLLFALAERWLTPKLAQREERAFDTIADSTPPVIICGFGRVGQIVGRILTMRGIRFTALEQDVAQVDFVRRFGSKVYYGDPTRPDVLRAAGAESARLLVVALADQEQSLRVVELARAEFPHLRLAVRARNRRHAHLLMDRGVRQIVRETFHSSLVLSGRVLCELGIPAEEAARVLATFEAHDERTLAQQQAVHHDEQQLIQSARQAADELRSLFEADRRR